MAQINEIQFKVTFILLNKTLLTDSSYSFDNSIMHLNMVHLDNFKNRTLNPLKYCFLALNYPRLLRNLSLE